MDFGIDAGDANRVSADLGRLAARAVPAASEAVRRTAFAIERDAKAFCPVDTGNLRSSISTDAFGLSAEVGPTAEYGIYVEQGTSVNAPQAFLGPSFDRNVGDLEKVLGALALGGGLG